MSRKHYGELDRIGVVLAEIGAYQRLAEQLPCSQAKARMRRAGRKAAAVMAKLGWRPQASGAAEAHPIAHPPRQRTPSVLREPLSWRGLGRAFGRYPYRIVFIAAAMVVCVVSVPVSLGALESQNIPWPPWVRVVFSHDSFLLIFLLAMVGMLSRAVLDRNRLREPLLAHRLRREAILRRSARAGMFNEGVQEAGAACSLSELVQRRRAAIISELKEIRAWEQRRVWMKDPDLWLWSFGVSLVPMVYFVGLEIYRTTGGTGYLSAWPLILAFWGSFFVGGLWFKHRCRRLARALEANRCTDCHYPLSGLPEGPLPRGGDATGLGPARCPECGAPWPRLPGPEEKLLGYF